MGKRRERKERGMEGIGKVEKGRKKRMEREIRLHGIGKVLIVYYCSSFIIGINSLHVAPSVMH